MGEGFSKNDSTKSSALFYGNAFIVSAIPVWLYWRIHSIDITSYAIVFAIGTVVSTWLLAFAYKNTKHLLKHKLAVKRESAVTLLCCALTWLLLHLQLKDPWIL